MNQHLGEMIGKVYKILAKKYHPDANLDNIEESEAKFKEISEAYEILSDEDKRKEYDILLAESRSANSIDVSEFQKLQNYCAQLENEISALNTKIQTQESTNTSRINYNSNNNYDYSSQYNNSPESSAASQGQAQAYEKYQRDQAYTKAYYDTLRSLGYKIKYEKTLKQKLKDLLAIIIAGILMIIIFKIIFLVPAFKQSLFPFLK